MTYNQKNENLDIGSFKLNQIAKALEKCSNETKKEFGEKLDEVINSY